MADRLPGRRIELAQRVALIGFMACGKTTVGRVLAGLLGWDFADLDDLVRKLPSEVRSNAQEGPLAMLAGGRLDDLLRHAAPHLLARLKREA